MAAKEISVPFVQAKQHSKSFFLTALSAADLVRISYVARRGVNEEEGSVQRLLNPTRIAGIRDFVLAGGIFPVSIVLNWSDKSTAPVIKSGRLIIHNSPQSAQIIDGQHRVIGLSAAIEKKKSLETLQTAHQPIQQSDNEGMCRYIFVHQYGTETRASQFGI